MYRKLLAYTPMVLLRTWSNGWFTTHRVHELDTKGDCLNCIFGCGGNDSLAHYVTCEHLWTLLYSCTGSLSVFLTYPVQRKVCLVGFHVNDISRCVVAYQAYHAMRNNNLEQIKQALQDENFDGILQTLVDYLNYFAEEHRLR